MSIKRISLPINTNDIIRLRSGDRVLLTGTLLTARDASHRQILAELTRGTKLPFDLKGQTIYYTGPTPTKPGNIIGAAGPTTSIRMDSYTFSLLDIGLKCMIGKGKRSEELKKKMLEKKAIYLAAIGGAGALLSKTIKSAKPVAYADLGPESVFEIVVEDFPAVVINDIYGGDLYIEGRAKYQIE